MLTIGSLFTGYGGLDLAVETVFGAQTVWHAEYEPPSKSNPRPSQAAAKLLAFRFPSRPNLGDVTTVNWTPVQRVDVLAGGFPCQDISHAGKRAGLRPDTRSGLWSQMAYAIDQLRPAYVVAENVRGLLSAEAHSNMEPCPLCVGDGPTSALRALGAVLGDLADLGYAASGSALGQPAGRDRATVADPEDDRCQDAQSGRSAAQRARTESGRGLATDPPSNGRHERWTEPAGQFGGPDAAKRGPAAPDAIGEERPRQRDEQPSRTIAAWRGAADPDWGPYEPAIRRWEYVLGRVAPAPIEPGPKGGPRLAPRFVEWMQGLSAGWVTDVPGITRNDMLRMLGNGVVPQQAVAALNYLLTVQEAA